MFKNAQTILVRDYAHAVGTQVKNNLASDRAVWSACSDEWGKGLGFGDKVFSHFENWSKQHQQVFTAYEKTDAEELIPFWREAAQPVQAPQFTLHVRNLRAIRLSAWTPEPVSVLIGANGAGKTTLLKTLKLLHKAYESDLSKAVADVLGGSFNMRSWGVAEDDPVEIGLDFGTIQWRIQLTSKAGTVSKLASESLHENGLEVFNRDSLGNFVYGHERIESGRPIGLRTLMDRGSHEYAVRTVATLLQRIAVYADFDLCGLRDNGSNAFDDHVLNARGTNVLAVLRRWRDERTNQHRYEFVIDGLQAAFPYTFESLDFIAAGNTLQANIYSPHHESPSPLAHEANGFLQLLIALCAVAGTDAESVIAIDEPECGLHPYALSAFFRRTTRWAERYNVTVLLATHSLVLLDESRPEQVYVMKSPDPGGSMPVRLDQLYNPKWLAHFKMEEMEETEDDGYRLGDLYERGEVGSAGELRRQPLGPLKLGELYERGEIGSNKDAE
jgi:predicted ATPase